MYTKILVTIIAFCFLIGCSKNKYNTKPTLKITSVNSNLVPVNGTLIFEVQVTDKEGDVTDSFFIKKVRINRKVTTTIRDSFAIQIPDAPNSKDGTIQASLTYQNYLISAQNPTENDTLLFKFALKDKGNNISDTVTSDPIVIIR